MTAAVALFLTVASFAGAFAGGVSAYLAAAWLSERRLRREMREHEQTLRESFGRVLAEWNANLASGDDDLLAADNERGRVH